MHIKPLVFILTLIPIVCLSQEKGFSVPVPMSEMVIKTWTSDNGLISNNLTSVNQTEDGLLWITSFNGLSRFDGNNFKLYDKENVSFLKTNAFQSVVNTDDGVIAATEGSGVVRYKDGQFFPIPQFNVTSAYKMMADSKGRLWCGTNLEGLFIMENGEVKKADFELFNNVLILDIYEDSTGRIWIATEGNGLVLFEKNIFSSHDSQQLANEKNVTSVTESAHGKIVVGTVNGVYTIDIATNIISKVPGLDGVFVNDLLEDKNGLLWIATERGLFRVNLQTGYFDAFDETNGFPAKQVSAVVIDREGNIWMSTKKAGLIRLSTRSILTLGEKDGLTSKRINIVEENDGKQFIGSDDGSIFIKENKKITKLDLSTKEQRAGIRDFAFENDEILVASYLGLHYYTRGKEELITTKDGLSSNLIRRILRTKDGFTWLASRSGGVMKLRGKKVVKVFNKDNGLNSNFILSLEEDNEGNVVVGTHSGGISIIRGDSVQNFAPDIKGLVNFNIYVDEENRYWISTSIGIFLFENAIFRQLKIESTLNTEAIFDFVPDQKGNAWMPSTAGIIMVLESQLTDFVNGERKSVQGRIFDHNEGMAMKECTGATRSTLLSDGTISVPTLDGVAIVDPENIRLNKQVPQINITSFSVDEVIVEKNESQIDPGKFRYHFEFTSASYSAPNRVRFKYQLSGVDEDWTTTSNNRIEYTNLKPGSYIFSVLGSNGNGIWNEVGESRAFTVNAFYFQTRWFKVVIALLIILMGYFVFIWRVRRVQAVNQQLSKLNNELDRFVYSASHDIRAPLTSILAATKIAIDQTSAEEKNQYLSMISESAKKLDGFIRDIIDYSRNQRLEIKARKINVEEEVLSIFESLKYLDGEGRITCTVEACSAEFVTDVRRVRVILRNIIANAFFYYNHEQKEPFVSIQCKINPSNLVITISDNGIGMKKEVMDNIFTMFYRGNTGSKGSGLGLYIVKENIEKLRGKISVDSTFKKGTTFTVIIPEANGNKKNS